MELLNKKQEYKLIKDAQNTKNPITRDIAFQQLISCNQGLVRKVANKFSTYELSIEELMSYGNEGLVTAILKFNFSKNTRLSTYAYNWIYQAIQKGLGKDPIIHKPLHLQTKRKQMINKEKELMDKDKFHRAPSIQTLSKALGGTAKGFSVDDIITLKHLNDISLRTDFVIDNNSHGKVNFDYFLQDENANPEKYTYNDIINSQILALLQKSLTPIELTVILMSFGMGPYQFVYKQEEIARALKISLDKVKHTKYYALKKLKNNKELLTYQSLILEID